MPGAYKDDRAARLKEVSPPPLSTLVHKFGHVFFLLCG